MNNEYPKHFSYNYEIDLGRVPARKTDRVSINILLPGIFFGALLAIIGVYEFLDGFISSSTAFDDLTVTTPQRTTLLTPVIFDFVMIAIGLGVVVSLVSSYIKYKKIFFDGSTFIITHRPLFGAKKVISESLTNYEGVRARIEYFQFGLINRNKYIIELYHEDNEKTIPLYISLKDKNLNSLIKSYAEKLGKPIIVMRGGDFVARTVEEFSQSLVDMDRDLDGYSLELEEYSPKTLVVARKGDKTILKVKRAVWDAYNVLAIFIILVLGFVLSILILNSPGFTFAAVVAYSFAVLGILASVLALFKRDKIIIKPEKIIVHHKFLGFSKKQSEMMKKDIKSIEVTTNPATGRSYLTIGTEDRDMIFGKKVPMDDLVWARVFLIKELIK
ncbi:MAG: hypothetical protein LBR70_06005 [Lactobacillaceae bacterium]|jgi:multisubunit Na+/H+ antiporter MnhB subunit|nr:hypothetical protein [Lactobacillaceae bacterium]